VEAMLRASLSRDGRLSEVSNCALRLRDGRSAPSLDAANSLVKAAT
jgi:hypothetical protein